jgi:hypothetical protein
MNLYLLSQTENRGYDTFDSCVVCAPNEEQAKTTHPCGDRYYVEGAGWIFSDNPEYTSPLRRTSASGWASPQYVTAHLIGVADPSVNAGVVIASFNAG